MIDPKDFDKITPDMYDDLNREIEEIWEGGCHGDCGSCESDCNENAYPTFAKVLLAVSGGKGGCGKSTITALLAFALTRKGYKVGVLDADLAGATMPLLLGAKGPIASQDNKVVPARLDNGMQVLSFNLITDKPAEPVLWPGADTFNVVNYLYTSTLWDELDVLLIDMPTGGGDVPINLYTAFPVDGTVIVGEDSALSTLPVQRCVTMTRMFLSAPWAYVENKTPDGQAHRAGDYDLPDKCVVTALPLLPELAGVEGDPCLKDVEVAGLEPVLERIEARIRDRAQ